MSDSVSNSKVNQAAHQIPPSAQYDLKSNDFHMKSVEVTRSSEDEATKVKTLEKQVMQFNATLERKRPSDPGADSSSAASSCPNQFLKTMVETNFPQECKIGIPMCHSCDQSLHLRCEGADSWVRWPLIRSQAECQLTQTREFL